MQQVVVQEQAERVSGAGSGVGEMGGGQYLFHGCQWD